MNDKLYSDYTIQRSKATARHISKQADQNDTLLVTARLIELYGVDYMNNPHAINLKLKILGLGVGDDRVKTKEFCSECGWRVFYLNRGFKCSGCGIHIPKQYVSLERNRARLARKKSLEHARQITNATPKRPYSTESDRDTMNER